eukprot:Nk52_evm43s621 gene=Nk52_evmTU43s621
MGGIRARVSWLRRYVETGLCEKSGVRGALGRNVIAFTDAGAAYEQRTHLHSGRVCSVEAGGHVGEAKGRSKLKSYSKQVHIPGDSVLKLRSICSRNKFLQLYKTSIGDDKPAYTTLDNLSSPLDEFHKVRRRSKAKGLSFGDLEKLLDKTPTEMLLKFLIEGHHLIRDTELIPLLGGKVNLELGNYVRKHRVGELGILDTILLDFVDLFNFTVYSSFLLKEMDRKDYDKQKVVLAKKALEVSKNATGMPKECPKGHLYEILKMKTEVIFASLLRARFMIVEGNLKGSHFSTFVRKMKKASLVDDESFGFCGNPEVFTDLYKFVFDECAHMEEMLEGESSILGSSWGISEFGIVKKAVFEEASELLTALIEHGKKEVVARHDIMSKHVEWLVPKIENSVDELALYSAPNSLSLSYSAYFAGLGVEQNAEKALNYFIRAKLCLSEFDENSTLKEACRVVQEGVHGADEKEAKRSVALSCLKIKERNTNFLYNINQRYLERLDKICKAANRTVEDADQTPQLREAFSMLDGYWALLDESSMQNQRMNGLFKVLRACETGVAFPDPADELRSCEDVFSKYKSAFAGKSEKVLEHLKSSQARPGHQRTQASLS